MLYGAPIALLLFSAVSASMVPACGRSFGGGGPSDRDAARAISASDDAAFSLALHYDRLIGALASSGSSTNVRYVPTTGMLVTAVGSAF